MLLLLGWHIFQGYTSTKTQRQENIAGDLFSNLTNAAAAASLALCASNLGRGVVTRSKPELIKQSEHQIGLDAHVVV